MLPRLLVVLFALGLTGCSDRPPPTGSSSYGTFDPKLIQFNDAPQQQTSPDVELGDLAFTDRDGRAVKLRDLLNDKNLVVVMTRGYNGAICPYCSTHTSRLIANYAEIQKLGADVVVIYPVEQASAATHLDEFLKRVNELQSAPAGQAVPFPVLLDVGLHAVDVLGIRKDLSKPATYILDRTGAVKFAYVGETLADRPSVKAILEQLQKLRQESQG
jgi:peroxiredoxin